LKRLLKDSAIYGLSGALVKFSAFLTLPIYTRLLSPKEFGILDLYITVAAFIFIFLETQMASSFMRDYYTYKKEGKLNQLLGNILWYYLYGYLLAFAVIFILHALFPQNKYMDIHYLLPIVLYIFPKQIFDLYAIRLRMENESKRYLYYTVSKIFTTALFGIITVVFIKSSPEAILWSIFLANLIFGILGYRFFLLEVGIKWTFTYIKSLLHFGIPVMFVVLANWLMSSVSKFLIIEYLSFKNLAIYSIALKIGILYLLFSQVFKMVWDPIAIENFSFKGDKNIYKKALNYYFSTGALFVFIIYINTQNIIELIATNEYADAAILAVPILSAYFWRGAIMIVSSGNAWVKKTYFDLIATAFGSIVGITVMYIYIATYKLQAVALGEFSAAFISFFLTLFFAQKNINIKYNYLTIIFFVILTFWIILNIK